tara:strand:+ start:7760 stop:8806 length:1047 start_codon:yes stop_codon:yes gene_type:complete
MEIKDPPRPKTLKDHMVSYSGLNRLAYSPLLYKKHILDPEVEDTTYFRKGSLLDCFLTEPEKEREMFAVANVEVPGGMMEIFCKVFAHHLGNEDQAFEAAYDTAGFKLKKDTVKKRLKDPIYETYIQFLRTNKDKQVVSVEEYEQARKMADMLIHGEFTAKYFKQSDEMMEVHNQLKIEWEYEVTDTSGNAFALYRCKSILDKVIIDHLNKTILPIDIKSTGKSVYDFENSFKRFGYFRQASFYTTAIRYWAILNGYGEYEIKNFCFVVAETACHNLPMIYQVSGQDLHCGIYGGKYPNRDIRIKGFNCLLKDLEFHQYTDKWDYRAEDYKEYEAHGSVLTKIFEVPK